VLCKENRVIALAATKIDCPAGKQFTRFDQLDKFRAGLADPGRSAESVPQLEPVRGAREERLHLGSQHLQPAGQRPDADQDRIVWHLNVGEHAATTASISSSCVAKWLLTVLGETSARRATSVMVVA
jgi:hypothetical protein